MYILIDDERGLGADVICRNYKAALRLLAKLDARPSDVLGIDFDLGGNESGNDLLIWAIAYKYLPKNIQIVTMNPVGRKQMINTLKDAGYSSNDSINFYYVEESK